MLKVIFTLSFVFILNCAGNAQQKGKLILTDIDAPSLANSLIGEPVKQPIAVYLPASYEKEIQKKYPVVYFLPGYEDTIAAYLKGYINSYFFENSMNSVITQGRVKEMIVVIVNGFNLLEGCFFHNSPVTGNWEDFVVKDVVNYIDKNYRTIPQSGSRAITGLSMGGYGATHISMLHPSVFSVAVGECAGLAAPDGMMKTSSFNDKNVILKVISTIEILNKLTNNEAHKKYIDTIYYYRKKHDWVSLFALAYASAFAPNTEIKAPYFDYPFTLDKDKNLVVDSVIFNRYELGFGNLKHKVETYKDSLLKLKGYGIDYGTTDFFPWIPQGNVYYDKLLSNAGIPHKLWKNGGGHGDWHKSRYEQVALPFCDSILTYDSEHLNNKAEIEKITFNGQASDPIIDNVNKTITVVFKPDAKINALKPLFYLTPGAKIIPATGTAIDLTSGTAKLQLSPENRSFTDTWTIKSSVATSIPSKSYNYKQLLISPNPVVDVFTVSSEDKAIHKIEIMDTTGRMVYKQNFNNDRITINKNKIGTGIFFVKAYTKSEFLSGKVLLL